MKIIFFYIDADFIFATNLSISCVLHTEGAVSLCQDQKQLGFEPSIILSKSG